MSVRLLVPIDFSMRSDAALRYARECARAFDGTMELLHVLPNVFLRPTVSDPHALEAAALQQLRDRLTEGDRGRAVAAVERSDEPADVIVSRARVSNADFIIMGTHGRSGVSHLFVGSVAEKVMRSAPCPVLTIRHTAATPRVRRILVPIDFSAPSDAALDCARSVASAFGASLHVLHVLEDARITGAVGSEVFVSESPEARSRRLKDALGRLAHRITPDDRTRLRATTEVIFGSAARTIADYAADNDFDLIIMGTHGRMGLAHLLMGSVAEHVIRTAACPVLTTHQPCSAAGRGETAVRKSA